MSEKRSLFGLLAEQRRFVYLAIAVLSGAGIWAALQLPSAIYPELTFSRVTVVVRGELARRASGDVQHHTADRRGDRGRAGRDARSVAIDSRRQRDEHHVRAEDGHDLRAAAGPGARESGAERVSAGLDIEVERLTPSLFPIISYNLEGGDPATLYDLARYQIKPIISRVSGVGRVDVQGSDVREIEVIADPARLAAQQMTFADLAAAIQASTTVDAVGRMPKDYRQYLIVTAGEAHSIGGHREHRGVARAARPRPRNRARPEPKTTCGSSPATESPPR